MTSELRPAVEVWRQAHQALYWLPKGAIGEQGAAAVIQAYGDEREANGRAEQAAELAKFKVLAETLAGALEQFDQGCAAIGGCSDGYCVIQRPKGQHTNGGCRCSDDRNRMRRFASRAAYFREKVAQALTSYKEQRDD